MSIDRLQEKIDTMKNPTVVGLDPALEHIPPEILNRHIKEKGETLDAACCAVFEFNIGIINALCDVVPAVKPQMAYYEALGVEGLVAFQYTCRYAMSKGMYVICDGKRNDIGTTAESYSTAYFGAVKVGSKEISAFEADALTINAYLGSDGVKPFLADAVKHDKAIFALVKTSNPSASEFQDMYIGERQLYVAVADLMEELSIDTIGKYGFTRIGAVVGATYPEEAKILRERLKHTFFLVPGYGAQGGSAQFAANAFKKDGRGAIVNSSRAILTAWKKMGGDYREAAYAEALRMRDELRAVL